ncbi:MAG: hypothetical protein BWY24_00740 [Microgenomates group bacterium ADurb.Bin219]|nr:MAG: hypothetical protein BWY24_00740 [Microgenomates group bacterium ADurb.Bin219]
MKNVIDDATGLANNILRASSSKKDLEIVNIAIKKSDTFIVDGYPSIPLSFGYQFTDTPKLMEQDGMILGKTVGWWYIGTSSKNSLWYRNRPQEIIHDGNVDEVAEKMGIIGKDQVIEYFFNIPDNNIGPNESKHMAVLVSRKKLEQFVGWYSGEAPQFDDKTGVFTYRGASITIKGKKAIKRFKLLFDNLGGIVTKHQFYEANGKEDYIIIKNSRGVTRLHDSLEKGFGKLVEFVESEPFLRKSVIMLQRDGFGMFIDKNAKL